MGHIENSLIYLSASENPLRSWHRDGTHLSRPWVQYSTGMRLPFWSMMIGKEVLIKDVMAQVCGAGNPISPQPICCFLWKGHDEWTMVSYGWLFAISTWHSWHRDPFLHRMEGWSCHNGRPFLGLDLPPLFRYTMSSPKKAQEEGWNSRKPYQVQTKTKHFTKVPVKRNSNKMDHFLTRVMFIFASSPYLAVLSLSS